MTTILGFKSKPRLRDYENREAELQTMQTSAKTIPNKLVCLNTK